MSRVFITKQSKNSPNVTVIDSGYRAPDAGERVYQNSQSVPLNPQLSQNPSGLTPNNQDVPDPEE
jgi:hypothetical protein